MDVDWVGLLKNLPQSYYYEAKLMKGKLLQYSGTNRLL